MILLDTNIVIYLFKDNKKIVDKLITFTPNDIYISFITFGELIFGAFNSQKKDQNLLKVYQFTKKVNVVHSTNEIVEKYGELKSIAIKSGSFPGDHDLW